MVGVRILTSVMKPDKPRFPSANGTEWDATETAEGAIDGISHLGAHVGDGFACLGLEERGMA